MLSKPKIDNALSSGHYTLVSAFLMRKTTKKNNATAAAAAGRKSMRQNWLPKTRADVPQSKKKLLN